MVAFRAVRRLNRLRRFFLFHRHSYIGVRRQADLIDLRHKASLDVVMVSFVSAFAAVFLGELDTSAFDIIDHADVNTVRADYFHVFFNDHLIILVSQDNARAGNTFRRSRRFTRQLATTGYALRAVSCVAGLAFRTGAAATGASQSHLASRSTGLLPRYAHSNS
jgi:hypothetical protein